MTDFGCAGGGRFQGAASFPRETRERGVGQGKKIRAASLGGQIHPGEPASLAISLNSPSSLTGRARRDGGGLLTGPLASKTRWGKTKID